MDGTLSPASSFGLFEGEGKLKGPRDVVGKWDRVGSDNSYVIAVFASVTPTPKLTASLCVCVTQVVSSKTFG